jgi:hypothetical protein
MWCLWGGCPRCLPYLQACHRVLVLLWLFTCPDPRPYWSCAQYPSARIDSGREVLCRCQPGRNGVSTVELLLCSRLPDPKGRSWGEDCPSSLPEIWYRKQDARRFSAYGMGEDISNLETNLPLAWNEGRSQVSLPGLSDVSTLLWSL